MGEVLEARTIENLVKLEGYGETLSKVDSKSLLGLQQISEYVHNKQSVVEYQDNVLGFATEWERVVTKRVDEDLKNVKGLQKTKRHYEIKVERLRRRTNKLESKRRAVPKALEEKLVRNEDKLQGMYEIHEEEAHKLCMLIECVTQHSWTELQQLINNTLQWEMERLNRENSVYSQRNLKSISEGIKQSGTHKY